MRFSKLAATGLGLLACTAIVAAQEPKPGQPQAQPKPAAPAPAPKDVKPKVSYAIGYRIAGDFKQQAIDLDLDQLMAGIKDGMAGAPQKFSEEEIEAAMAAFQQQLIAAQTERMKVEAVKAKAEGAQAKQQGDAFLAQNKAKPGVKTTASGLQYQITQEGTGASPKATDTVKVHYRGTLLDGTEFDSSYKRNEPAVFPLNRVIPGWTEGLQLLKVGGKARLFIPPGLAYGETPPPGSEIKPNSVLIFDVELLEVNPAQ